MKPTRPHFAKILTITASLTIGPAAFATVVYENDFNSDALGTVAAPFDDTGGTGSYFDIVAGNANFATQHGELASRSDNANYAFGNFDGGSLASDPGFASVTTFTFDLRLNSATFAGGQLRMRARDTGFSGGTTDTVRFDLNAGDISFDTIHSIQYVVNNSTSSAIAPDVGGTIGAGMYAIYSDGGLLASGNNFTAADNLAVDKLTLWVRGDNVSDPISQSIVQIDNWEVHVVPEPSGAALLGVGALGLLVRRRR